MLKDLVDTPIQFSEERKKLIKQQRARWQGINYGETDSNIAKYNRQVDKYGRIKYW